MTRAGDKRTARRGTQGTRGSRPRLRAIRGAISVPRDEPSAIYEATRELLSAIVTRNRVATADIISVIFTVTPDLRSAFPALAARQMGWLDVPLLCTMEIPVPDALGHCIRVLLHVETTRARAQIEHVYLRAAEALRPDARKAGVDRREERGERRQPHATRNG